MIENKPVQLQFEKGWRLISNIPNSMFPAYFAITIRTKQIFITHSIYVDNFYTNGTC